MVVKLTVQGNIWIGNKSRLIMVTIYGNRYRSMICLYMMFLKEKRGSLNTRRKYGKYGKNKIIKPPSCSSHQIIKSMCMSCY